MQKLMLFILLVMSVSVAGTVAFAQDQQVTGDQDGSSQQVEESDEAYRRRMELEDARRANPTYTDPVDSYRRDLEKIDKLPEESRENIRDQLVDVIMQNDDWKPGDALNEYPYEPSAAAQADAELMQQEQEAWDEQIEKYHARESAAFGAYRGPVEGPGNPDGAEGGQGSEGSEGGQQGQHGSEGGQQGGQGEQSESSQASTYQPYQSQSSSRNDAESTAGVSESALDFLKKRQSGQPSGQANGQEANQQPGQPAGEQASENSAQQQQMAQDSSQESSQQDSQQSETSQEQAEDSQEPEQPVDPDMRGIIAIEDLNKLEGTGGNLPAPPEQQPDEDDGGP
jgi:Ni/Co efflux regulator RcnB